MVKIQEISHDKLKVEYRGKKYTINITEELSINENIINSQLKAQPSNYAFLCLIRDESIKERDLLEKEKDEAYSEAWLYWKEHTNCNNDAADHRATTTQKYQSKLEDYIKAAHTAARLISICKAYETRERILQSLNANLRKQQ